MAMTTPKERHEAALKAGAIRLARIIPKLLGGSLSLKDAVRAVVEAYLCALAEPDEDGNSYHIAESDEGLPVDSDWWLKEIEK